MIVNILIDLIQTKLALENFYYIIYIICEISLILFYIIEKYLSKNEEEINKKNQIEIEVILLIICLLIFKCIHYVFYH
jgi:hypothetical protein